MVEERKDWIRFYGSTRKKDLVYLVNESLSTVKLLSCKILEIPKSWNPRKVQEEGKIGK